MKNLLSRLIDLVNPNSEKNIDREISFFKRELKDHLNISDVKSTEEAINQSTDSKVRLSLKINLKNELKEAYDEYQYEALKDSIDKAW